MATARAIASGNWSATGTWNGGVLPGNGDTVYANGFTVTINQNVDIGGANNPIVNAGSFVSGQWYEITSVGTTSFPGAASNTVGTIFQANGVGSGTGQARARATLTTATNTAAGATAGGGGFVMSSSYNTATDLRSGTTTCLTVNGSANVSLSNQSVICHAGFVINFNSTGLLAITNSYIQAGNANQNAVAIVNSVGGTVSINSSNIVAAWGHAIINSSGGTITISNSNLAGGNSNPCVANGVGIINVSFSTINPGSFSSSAGVNNSGAGVVNIDNSTLNANSFSAAVSNSSNNATLNFVSCTYTASNAFNCVSSTNSATNRFSGIFISSSNGTQPIGVTKWILGTQPINSYIQIARDGINLFDRYYTADNSLGQAAPTDVRSGVSYASGNLTGRLTVPVRGTVSNGVTVGPNMPFTATRSGTTATATLTYSYPYQVGDIITITGASNNEWNMDYTITEVVSGTSVRWTVPATHSATAGTGANAQTKGTATLDVSAVASAVWGAATTSLTTAGSIGERLKNAATVDSTGTALATALTAP